ncbi:hypothetical protein L9F63_010895 [Diploptera punctata]|uniref:legumain n=1 Tax=Diploptera punctata TaxID=6984 RepID=A0AAD8EPJ3_DIPPU|nr:hypothetical protein L9F63_010895 [Diploptera punctata]
MWRQTSIIVTLTVVLQILTAVNGYQLPNGGKIWALLVAGSNGFDNYRHQADICHAYQILHRNGIPDENIVVMMYDDIAYAHSNLDPGVIINQPNGPNVYEGVPKDYTGETVNSTNFLKILSGDEKGMEGVGSGRVIKSGPKDHIFVNFVDHGATGLLAFPDLSGQNLYAPELLKTFQQMAAKKTVFKTLVMYVEACESGSMFDGILPTDLNELVSLLSFVKMRQSSYACYYDPELGTYLGDFFSVLWMQDSEKENLVREMIHQQFEIVRTETNTSHVEEYGDLVIGSLHVSEFLGYRPSPPENKRPLPAINMNEVVSSRDVPLGILKMKKHARSSEEREHYAFHIQRMTKSRKHLEKIVSQILLMASGYDVNKVEHLKNMNYKLKLEDYDCYKALVSLFSEECFKISENAYALSQLKYFANICGDGDVQMASALIAIKNICTFEETMNGVD